MASDDDIIIIENGPKPAKLELYFNVDDPAPLQAEAAAIAAKANANKHISTPALFKLFLIARKVLP